MNYLLDTHTFLWLNERPERLSANMRTVLGAGEERFFLSMVSPWEIKIKQQLGKLELKQDLSIILASHLDNGSIELLPIELPHIERLGTLELHHRDPFDRMLIVSADRAFSAYPVEVIW
jgi:PIN domain nuclease of toxin-antitoxin system